MAESGEAVNHDQMISESGTIVYDKYRARLMDANDVPFIGEISTFNGKKIILIDAATTSNSDLPQQNVSLECVGELELTDRNNDHAVDDTKFGGSPLKFEFLTLSRLEANDGKKRQKNVTVFQKSEEWFKCSPLDVTDARCLMNKLITKNGVFDVHYPHHAVFAICNGADCFETVALGVQKLSKRVATYSVRAFARGDDQVLKHLRIVEDHLNMYDISASGIRANAHCVYDVVPHTTNAETDDAARISASVTLTTIWPSMPGSWLLKPPPFANISLQVSPGWLDYRMPLYEWTDEIRLILALGHALRVGKMDWTVTESTESTKFVIDDIEKLIKEESLKKCAASSSAGPFRDFTERLWMILRFCNSNEMLTEALRYVFNALKAGFKNTMMHSDNRSTMARLLRDACSNELLLPRLEGLTPVQILLEMGLEYLRRSCVALFISDGFFESAAEINTLFDNGIGKEPQDQADALFLLFNSLVAVKICKQYLRLDRHHVIVIARRALGQFNALKISPTLNGVTTEMVENMNFNVSSKLTFADVYPGVHKIKKPKIWRMESIHENKEMVLTSLVHFSRESKLAFIKCRMPSDPVPVGDKAGESGSSGPEHSEKQTDEKQYNEKVLVGSQEETNLQAVLDGYYCTVVYGSIRPKLMAA